MNTMGDNELFKNKFASSRGKFFSMASKQPSSAEWGFHVDEEVDGDRAEGLEMDRLGNLTLVEELNALGSSDMTHGSEELSEEHMEGK